MEKANLFINLVKLKMVSGKMVYLLNDTFDELKKIKNKFKN